MHRRFIIIHQSHVIQKGLHVMLRDTFNADFLLLSSVNELNDYAEITDSSLFIFYDKNADVGIDHILTKFKQKGNKTYSLEITDKGNSNTQLSIYDTQTLLIKKIKDLIEPVAPNTNELSELSDREKDVLKLVALGHQNKEIADKLFISIHTVISHRKNITDKLGIKSISGLTVYAILNKLIDTDNIDLTTLI